MKNTRTVVREDEWADRPGAAFWWSAFTFFRQGFAIFGASMHPTAAFSVGSVLTAARPWSASRRPIASEHKRPLSDIRKRQCCWA